MQRVYVASSTGDTVARPLGHGRGRNAGVEPVGPGWEQQPEHSAIGDR